jgi:hypothetical protein
MASDKGAVAYGLNYVFHQVPYTGAVATFQVDQTCVVAVCVWPASGPTVSIAAASLGLKTLTLAAGGSESGGNVVICTAHGKSIASYKP